jgi:hypothetical protein
LPDGTASELIAILCRLSRDHGVDWQFSHDASDGPIGEIRAGVCDEQVLAHVELFADLGDASCASVTTTTVLQNKQCAGLPSVSGVNSPSGEVVMGMVSRL